MVNVRIVNVMDPVALASSLSSATFEPAVIRAMRRDCGKRGWADRQPRYATGGIVGNPAATRWRRPTILRLYIHRLGRWLCRY